MFQVRQVETSDDLKRIGGIDKALEFYNLACKALFK